MALGQPRSQSLELDIDNLLQLILRQPVEVDHFVHAIQKFRPEQARQIFLLRVRGHDHDGVLEIHRTTLAIGQPSVVQKLQQDVEHVAMRLLDFIKENHAIRPAADGFGQLAAFFVTDVSRRRANQARHGVLFLIFRHVDADQRAFVVKEILREEHEASSVLPTPGRSQKNKAANGPLRIFRGRRGRA